MPPGRSPPRFMPRSRRRCRRWPGIQRMRRRGVTGAVGLPCGPHRDSWRWGGSAGRVGRRGDVCSGATADEPGWTQLAGLPPPGVGVPVPAGLGFDLREPAARRRVGGADDLAAAGAFNLPPGVLGAAFQGLVAVRAVELEFVRFHRLHPRKRKGRAESMSRTRAVARSSGGNATPGCLETALPWWSAAPQGALDCGCPLCVRPPGSAVPSLLLTGVAVRGTAHTFPGQNAPYGVDEPVRTAMDA